MRVIKLSRTRTRPIKRSFSFIILPPNNPIVGSAKSFLVSNRVSLSCTKYIAFTSASGCPRLVPPDPFDLGSLWLREQGKRDSSAHLAHPDNPVSMVSGNSGCTFPSLLSHLFCFLRFARRTIDNSRCGNFC